MIDRTWTPSQREVDAGIGYGFGTTINIINGGIECGAQNKDKGQPVNRIRYWQGLSHHYNIAIASDEEDTCWQQTPYGSLNLDGASDVLYTNWEEIGPTTQIDPEVSLLNVNWWATKRLIPLWSLAITKSV